MLGSPRANGRASTASPSPVATGLGSVPAAGGTGRQALTTALAARPFVSGGYNIGSRYLTQGQVDAIRAQNLSHPQTGPPQPQVQPLTAVQAQGLASVTRGYQAPDDPTHTATDPAIVQNLRQRFSGPGVAGYNLLSDTLGK